MLNHAQYLKMHSLFAKTVLTGLGLAALAGLTFNEAAFANDFNQSYSPESYLAQLGPDDGDQANQGSQFRFRGHASQLSNNGQQGGQGGPGGNYQGQGGKGQLLEELNLSEDQKAQLKEIFQKKKESGKVNRQAMMEKRKQLRDMLSNSSGTRQQALSLQREISSQQSQMMEAKINTMFDIKDVMTDEQFAQFQSTMKQRHQRRGGWQGRQGGPNNQGGQMGPGGPQGGGFGSGGPRRRGGFGGNNGGQPDQYAPSSGQEFFEGQW